MDEANPQACLLHTDLGKATRFARIWHILQHMASHGRQKHIANKTDLVTPDNMQAPGLPQATLL